MRSIAAGASQPRGRIREGCTRAGGVDECVAHASPRAVSLCEGNELQPAPNHSRSGAWIHQSQSSDTTLPSPTYRTVGALH